MVAGVGQTLPVQQVLPHFRHGRVHHGVLDREEPDRVRVQGHRVGPGMLAEVLAQVRDRRLDRPRRCAWEHRREVRASRETLLNYAIPRWQNVFYAVYLALVLREWRAASFF